MFQGLLFSTPDNFNNVAKLSKLWLHESERVADRLVSAKDLETYNGSVVQIANKFFKIPGMLTTSMLVKRPNLIFCHFAGGSRENLQRHCGVLKLQKI